MARMQLNGPEAEATGARGPSSKPPKDRSKGCSRCRYKASGCPPSCLPENRRAKAKKKKEEAERRKRRLGLGLDPDKDSEDDEPPTPAPALSSDAGPSDKREIRPLRMAPTTTTT